MLVLLPAGKLFSQTAVIPDPLFRQFLVTNYPGVMNTNQELIISNAALVTGTFQCSNLNITNLDGVQYFTKVNILYCFNNKLITLPDLNGMTNILQIHAYQNQLRYLPSFNTLKTLKVLILGDNLLDQFPEVDSLNNLTELYVYRNQLTQIPDLVRLSKLQMFHCYENKITKIGKMPASLIDLAFENNLMTALPDISLATGLIHILGNKNHLTSLPDLSTYNSLTDCIVFKNQLTFEDFISSSSNPNFNQWMIYPQDSVAVQSQYRLIKSQKVWIDIYTDSTVSGLTYSWYQNGSLREQTTGPKLEITSPAASDNGIYYCKITSSNPALSALTLNTRTFSILVLPDFKVEEELSLTPNGDGKNDELYFEEPGLLYVYDSKGKILDQQFSPCYWNGTTKSGTELITGFYILRLKDTFYRITIIR
jgi:internalin A